MTGLAKILGAAAALCLALAVWFAVREHRARGEREAALRALSAAQARAAGLEQQVAQASAVVRVRVDTVRVTVTQWRQTVAADPTPRIPVTPDTGASRDSLRSWVTQLAQANIRYRAVGDSMARACTDLASACDTLRVRVDSLRGALADLRTATERAVRAAPPRRWWSPLGCSAPAAVTRHGVDWGAACGVSASF